MTSLIAAIGEGSSLSADVLCVQRAFVFPQPLFLGWALSKRETTTCLLPSPSSLSHQPMVPAFSTTSETLFTLSLNEDISEQLGSKSKNQRALCSMQNWLETTHQTVDSKRSNQNHKPTHLKNHSWDHTHLVRYVKHPQNSLWRSFFPQQRLPGPL